MQLFRSELGAALTLIVALAGTLPAAAVELTRDDAIGAKFGMPGPRICSTLSETQDGTLTDDEARAFVICSIEEYHQGGAELLYLLADVQVHIVNARPFNGDGFEDIDNTKTIYEIAGSSIKYSCSLQQNVSSPDQQCTRTPNPNDTGLCYQVYSGDFRCFWSDFDAPISNDTRLAVRAPTLAEVE